MAPGLRVRMRASCVSAVIAACLCAGAAGCSDDPSDTRGVDDKVAYDTAQWIRDWCQLNLQSSTSDVGQMVDSYLGSASADADVAKVLQEIAQRSGRNQSMSLADDACVHPAEWMNAVLESNSLP